MAKKLSLILGFIFLTSNIQSQIVRFVDHKFQADIVVYCSEYRYNADLIIHLTPYIYKAENTPGIWWINGERSWYSRELLVFNTPYQYEADFIVYFTPYEYDTRINRKYLLYWP